MKLPSVWTRTSSLRQVVTVLLLALVVFACGKEEEQPRVAGHPPSAAPGAAATGTSAPASPPAAATTAAAPAVSAAASPPAKAPARPAPQRPRGEISLPAKLGAVTFDHERHAKQPGTTCATCHHPSRPQKPLASESQACRDCHTAPAVPPMETSRQAAFHDPKGATGTCIDCHRKQDGAAPLKCLECHKKK